MIAGWSGLPRPRPLTAGTAWWCCRHGSLVNFGRFERARAQEIVTETDAGRQLKPPIAEPRLYIEQVLKQWVGHGIHFQPGYARHRRAQVSAGVEADRAAVHVQAGALAGSDDE